MAKTGKSTKTKHLSYNGLYDFYELYEITHGRSMGYKLFETQLVIDAVNEIVNIDKTVRHEGICLLDQFSGRGEYAEAWHILSAFTNAGVAPTHFGLQDIHRPAKLSNLFEPNKKHWSYYETSVIDHFPDDQDYNVVLAPYYSLNSIGTLSRDKVLTWLKRVAAGLKASQGGILYLHFSENGESSHVEEANDFIKADYYVPPFAPLRQRLKVANDGPFSVVMTTRRWYNRLDNLNYEAFSDIAFYKGSKKLDIAVKIKQPLCFRYWSESEIVDLLREAGFDLEASMFGYADMGAAIPFVKLEHKLQNNPDSYEPHPNMIFAVVKSPRRR